MPNSVTTLRRQLGRSISLLVSGTVTLFLLGAWLLLLKPSLDNLANDRIDQIATGVQGRLSRLSDDGQRLLRVAADWLGQDDLTLDHRSLNRRFIPLLQHYPVYSSLRVADTAGNEWMLFRRSDNTWLNRLTKDIEPEPTRRFLSWSDTGELLRDERLESDYSTLQRPWARLALKAPAGVPVWSEIHRLQTSHAPGITAVMRVRTDDNPELLLGLDLELNDLATHLAGLELGDGAQAVLITDEGRLLGAAGLPRPTATDMVFQPVIALELQPLKQGFELWLERGTDVPPPRLSLHGNELWHLNFLRLALGERNLWLGTFLPVSSLMPGIYIQLAALGALLLFTLISASLLGRLLARDLSRPLKQLTSNNRRIGELDFTPAPILPRGPQEIRELAEAQEEMRARLADAYDRLPQGFPANPRKQDSSGTSQ